MESEKNAKKEYQKKTGNPAYKKGIEPIEYLFSKGLTNGGYFSLGNIIKYASRIMTMLPAATGNNTILKNKLKSDLDKIIHYAEILRDRI